MTAVESKTSSPSKKPEKPEKIKKTDQSEANGASEPVKRPRGRPRKTSASEPKQTAEKKSAQATAKQPKQAAKKKTTEAATKKAKTEAAAKQTKKADDKQPAKPAEKKSSDAKPVVHVPRDQPSEWIVPRDKETKKPESDTRASSVKKADDDTVRRVAEDASDDVSAAEISARREAARAVVADIDRMKDDVRSMNSYIATPPPEVASEQQEDEDVLIDETTPLSRREYWKQRRQERYLQRQQRRASVVSGSNTSDNAFRSSTRQTSRSRKDFSHDESSAKQTEPLPPLKASDLQGLSVDALLSMVEEQKVFHLLASHAKPDIVFALLRNYAACGGSVIGEGVLEISREGHGFLRNPGESFRNSPEDAMVPLQVIRKFSLRSGDRVSGVTRPPSRDQRDRRFVVIDVVLVNDAEPGESFKVPFFDALEGVHPNRRIQLETTADEVEMRVADLFTPIGFGQRGLILAPPRTGRRVLLRKLADAIKENHPEATVMILLIDDRPEEVTDMKRKTNVDIYASTFDQSPANHIRTAEVAVDLARRGAERGEDVIVLLDSLTRLAKAYNALEPHGGRILKGDLDANALHKTKRLFSAARNFEAGGSLTLIATLPVETISTDDVIVEEFQNAANTLFWLDRQLAERRIYPALDIARSGTRHDSQLLTSKKQESIFALRKTLESFTAEEAMQAILKRMAETTDNDKLLATLSSNA